MAATSTSTCIVTKTTEEEPLSSKIEQVVVPAEAVAATATTTTTTTTTKSTQASIRYLKWQDLYSHEKPFQIFLNIPPDAIDQRESNLVFEQVDRGIEDIRGRESNFSLDGNGFRFVEYHYDDGVESGGGGGGDEVGREEVDFKNKEEVEERYLPRIERLIKENVEGADEVLFIYNFFLSFFAPHTLPPSHAATTLRASLPLEGVLRKPSLDKALQSDSDD